MRKASKTTLFDTLVKNGLYSEYLPPCFNIDSAYDKYISKNPPKSNNANIEPTMFTMDRYSADRARREIYIPELTSYILAMKFIRDNNLFDDIVRISNSSKNSFTHLFNTDGSLSKHEDDYNKRVIIHAETEDQGPTYLNNTAKKIIVAMGAKGILSLDIASFYQSIYTHIIPAIFLGRDKAMELYKNDRNTPEIKAQIASSEIWSNYAIYKALDEKLRAMNGSRTNGLLTGPIISKFIAEALLSRIDVDLNLQNITYTRYMDDYEISVYDERDIGRIKSCVEKALNDHFLHLNSEKTKYTEYPYYVIDNLESFYENAVSDKITNDRSIMELFNYYIRSEHNGIKGSIRFLVKKIDKRISIHNHNLYMAYLINFLANDSRSLVKVCQLITGSI